VEVTGDVAGFAAATYLRGIRQLVQIRLPCWRQVDSSWEGKPVWTCPAGKIWWEHSVSDLVLIDRRCSHTAGKDIFAGMAEVIKYGCISDPEI
jgi:3-dehydroquinate synthase